LKLIERQQSYWKAGFSSRVILKNAANVAQFTQNTPNKASNLFFKDTTEMNSPPNEAQLPQRVREKHLFANAEAGVFAHVDEHLSTACTSVQ